MRRNRRWGWLGSAAVGLLSWGCGEEGTTLHGYATGGDGPSGTAGAGQRSGGGRAGETASPAGAAGKRTGSQAGNAPVTGAGGDTNDAGAGRSGALSGGAGSEPDGGATSGGVDAGGAAGRAGKAAGAGRSGGGAWATGAAGAGVGTGGAGGFTTYGDVPDTPACAAYREDGLWSTAWAGIEAEVVDRVNAERRAGTDCPDGNGEVTPNDPVDDVTVHPEVRCAARAHSYDMADRDYYSSGTWDDSAEECAGRDDTCPTSGYICRQQVPGLDPYRCLQGPGLRLTDAGYAYNGYFEVIGSNYPTADDLVTRWMDDPGLCADLMDGTFVDIGVGYITGPGTGESRWTVLLALPQ